MFFTLPLSNLFLRLLLLFLTLLRLTLIWLLLFLSSLTLCIDFCLFFWLILWWLLLLSWLLLLRLSFLLLAFLASPITQVSLTVLTSLVVFPPTLLIRLTFRLWFGNVCFLWLVERNMLLLNWFRLYCFRLLRSLACRLLNNLFVWHHLLFFLWSLLGSCLLWLWLRNELFCWHLHGFLLL